MHAKKKYEKTRHRDFRSEADAADAVWRWQFSAVGGDRSTSGIWTAKLELIDAEASEKKWLASEASGHPKTLCMLGHTGRHLTPPQFD